MSGARRQPQAVPQDTTPPPNQTTPSGIGYGHPEYQFVQSIMEMQKSLGQINASLETLNKTVDSTKTKVDDLVKWKNMIFGGAIVLGAICSLAGFFVSKMSSYVTFKAPEEQAQSYRQQPRDDGRILAPQDPQREKPQQQSR